MVRLYNCASIAAAVAVVTIVAVQKILDVCCFGSTKVTANLLSHFFSFRQSFKSKVEQKTTATTTITKSEWSIQTFTLLPVRLFVCRPRLFGLWLMPRKPNRPKQHVAVPVALIQTHENAGPPVDWPAAAASAFTLLSTMLPCAISCPTNEANTHNTHTELIDGHEKIPFNRCDPLYCKELVGKCQ